MLAFLFVIAAPSTLSNSLVVSTSWLMSQNSGEGTLRNASRVVSGAASGDQDINPNGVTESISVGMQMGVASPSANLPISGHSYCFRIYFVLKINAK